MASSRRFKSSVSWGDSGFAPVASVDGAAVGLPAKGSSERASGPLGGVGGKLSEAHVVGLDRVIQSCLYSEFGFERLIKSTSSDPIEPQ